MFNLNKLKYSPVETDIVEDKTVEFEPMKRKFCTPLCVRNSLFTCILIGAYYVPSIGLTFYQQWLYKTFRFPLITVITHMLVKLMLATLIREVLIRKQRKERLKIECRDYMLQIASTGVFSGIDIGFSNWALELITISLYTMTKSTTIVFILFFSILFKLERMTWSLCGIVGLITTGLFLFTYKAVQFDILGFILLLLASLSSGLRWTCVQLMMQKSQMGMKDPVDMIYYMQPWMIICLIPFAVWIEGPKFLTKLSQDGFDSPDLVTISFKVLLGAFIAFFMEFSEVTLVAYTSSLTLSIAGIFKEIINLVLAVKMNGDILSPLNIMGLLICLGGITTHVVHKMKTVSARSTGRPGFGVERAELREKLMFEDDLKIESDSDGEKSDSQVLFDILNRHDR